MGHASMDILPRREGGEREAICSYILAEPLVLTTCLSPDSADNSPVISQAPKMSC